MQGFSRFLQENILVQNRGDITVNATLQIGAVAETIKVIDSPVPIQFNTSSMDLTVDNTMVKNLPVMARNPFTLALLDPGRSQSLYAANEPRSRCGPRAQLEVGGPTSRRTTR